jgi:hypothetical protein
MAQHPTPQEERRVIRQALLVLLLFSAAWASIFISLGWILHGYFGCDLV